MPEQRRGWKWIGAGLEELTIQKTFRCRPAGLFARGPPGRNGPRRIAPQCKVEPRHQCCTRARDLDADYVVFGNFTSDGTSMTVNARVLRVNPVALLPAVRETGSLDSMMNLHTRLTLAVC